MHILNSTCISEKQRRKANKLLNSFVNEFEELYGEINMVYNVHQLKHLVECVNRNGPLSTYSNYPMEDYIGHLRSLVKGTTDVTSQICSRYLLEKELHVQLNKSQLARQYYETIESKLSFPIVRKVSGLLVLGKAKIMSHLNERELKYIRNSLHVDDYIEIQEYRSAFLDNRFFYEISSNNTKKRTIFR